MAQTASAVATMGSPGPPGPAGAGPTSLLRARVVAEDTPADLTADDVLATIGDRPGARLVSGAVRGWQSLHELSPVSHQPSEVEPAPADDPCLVLYTSGTTAAPKGAVHSSATLLQEVRSMQREWALTWRDVMTEFPTTTLAGENDPLERRAHTDGHIAEAVEVEAVDEDRRPLPLGHEGELRVRGPERMLGYVDGAASAEVVDDAGWFYTGDLGAVDDAGYVTITGRRKDIINRGGEKFSAREIEDLLARYPGVAEVAVVGVPGGRLGERVCAAVVARDRGIADPGQLRSFLESQRIARQKIPEEFLVVDELPRTPAGKVQKFLIVERWEDGRLDGPNWS